MHDRDSRDSSDSCGHPFDHEFRRLLQEIPRWSAELGTGRWHCAQDIEDELLRIVEDHLLKGTTPKLLRPWAFATYKNLVKSGPPKANQSRHAELDPASGDASSARMERIDLHSAWIAELEQILPDAMDLLTEAERRALDGIRGAVTMSEAAELADMTPQHLRTRLWRIVGKIARLLEEK